MRMPLWLAQVPFHRSVTCHDQPVKAVTSENNLLLFLAQKCKEN